MDIESLGILVVEESDALRAAIVEQLRTLGATRVDAADGGADALTRMQDRPFDVVLSGWNMKVMDGLALLRAIRADERLHNVAMIMVTGDVGQQQIEEAVASGVSELLVKPYTRALLHSKIVGSVERERRPASVPVPPPAPGSTVSPTLLVVDDTPDNLQLIAQLFTDRFEVRAVRSGERALQICTSDQPPDLVLLDVMMPGIDGFEVARRMRAHPNSEHIPVIFVTALTSPADERAGLDLGAVDFVTKPIDPELLQLRVSNFMRLVARQKQRQAECDAQLAAARMRESAEELLRHDLRNPLAGVIGAAGLLAKQANLAPPQARLVGLISTAATQAIDLVNLSNAMFRIQTGRFTLAAEPVPIGRLLREALQLAAIWRDSKSLDFRLELPPGEADGGPWALGDASLCSSILNNLLRNACEASPAGAAVVIEVDAADTVQVRLGNAGVVPLAARQGFFDRYVTSGKRGGSGLGTYSARLLTEAQGGSITMATDDAAARTTLTVALPRAPQRR